MYQTVVFDYSLDLGSVLRSNPDLVSRLLRFTKHLCISNPASSEDASDILSRFSPGTLLSLSCFIGSAKQFSCLVEKQRLQHLSLGISVRVDIHLASSSPLSSSLTHLEIYSPFCHMPKLDPLTRLTHLSVPYHWFHKGWVRTTLENCRALKVLVIQGRMNEADALILHGIDCRVVGIDYTTDPQYWEESWSSEQGIWGRAEAVIAKRECFIQTNARVFAADRSGRNGTAMGGKRSICNRRKNMQKGERAAMA